MKTKQCDDIKNGNKDRVSILIDAVMKIVESYRITRSDLEYFIAILQEESIVTGFGSDKVICDIVEDPEVLQSVAYLLYSEAMSEAAKCWSRRAHEPRVEIEILKDHLHTKYQTEKDPAFYIDYERLHIMSGLNYEQQLDNRRTLYEVKKIFRLTKTELSKKLSECGLTPFIKGLIELLIGPKGDEVISTYKKLVRMNKRELKIYIDNLSVTIEWDHIRHLAQLLYRF